MTAGYGGLSPLRSEPRCTLTPLSLRSEDITAIMSN